MRTVDVAIVGGGIIGASIAFELASEKLRVSLLERQQLGREASWAAAGMLSPSPHSAKDLPLVPLAKESLRLYPKFAATIEDESGKSVAYDRPGVLEIFTDPRAESQRDKVIVEYRALGLTAEPVSIEDARKLFTELGASAAAAAWLPNEETVDPRALMDALIVAVRRRGVEVLADSPVSALHFERGRCTGVSVGAETISASHVVVAAGCFSGGIAPDTPGKNHGAHILSRYAAVKPIRGQMLALRPVSMALRHVLRSQDAYLVPRRDGRIVAGSTLEDVGFEKCVTPVGLSKIISGACKLWPALSDAAIVETWCGLRPGTPDDLPILGPTEEEGLLIATGHYRNGILLAPVSAKLISEWIIRGKTTFDALPFSPLRFLNGQGQQRGANAGMSPAKRG
jgi:glycine oxidase